MNTWPCLFCIHRANIFEKMRKTWSAKSILNPHFKGFWRNISLTSVQDFKNCAFWYRRSPKMSDGWSFREDFCVSAISLGRRAPFFGPSLLSYSRRKHLNTPRVIPLKDYYQSLYQQHRILSTFCPNLCFVWLSHKFRFLGCALPIGLSPSPIPATWGPKRATAGRFWKRDIKFGKPRFYMDFPIHCQNTLSNIETFPRWRLIATFLCKTE